MRTILLRLLLCVPCVSAQTSNPQTLTGQYEALLKEFEASLKAWEKALDDAKEGSEPVWPGRAFVPRFLKLAEANPGEPGATDALLWVVNKAMNIQVGGRDFYPHYRHALELLTRGGHLDDARLGQACTQGLRYPSAPAERFLRLLIDRSRDRELRGRACLALAKILADKAEFARHPLLNPNARSASDKDFIERLDPECIKYLRAVDVKASKDEAEHLFERSIKDYGDIVYHRGQASVERDVTIGDAAKSALHELRDLAIGKVAPEIAGEDLEGRPMKLSDHRGKVVVLVFWATWCGPCMGLVPHERTLVERLKSNPFVLLGIDCDDDREQAKRTVGQERITWQSWWNAGASGPITQQYNVEGVPSVYVLDARGVIRHKQVIEKTLDQAVDALLKEMEDARPQGTTQETKERVRTRLPD